VNVAGYLIATARSFPESRAITVGTRPYASYVGLMKRVARLAGGLRNLGLTPGDRVGLAMVNCPEYFEVMYGIWHAGLCAVPMNAKLHARECAYILANSDARICFATEEIAEALSVVSGELRGLKRLVAVGGADYDALCRADPIALQPTAFEDPAWLFYTSGTTGKPKGAILSHRSLAGMTLRYFADVDQIGPADCIVHASPLSHATGLFAMPHVAKASNHIIPESLGFDADEVVELTRRHSSLSMFAAPTMLTRILNCGTVGSVRTEAIRSIAYGGAPMYVEDLKRALAVFGPRLIQLYGQAEMPATITYLAKSLHSETEHPRYEERLASTGIARTGVEVRIVDSDGRNLPPGEIGEVAARSDVCMTAYWNNPDATAQTLHDGWLFTGDLGMLDDEGFLTLKDRSKDVIISGGTNIYPREVEEVLLLHPDVLEVCVVGRPHSDWGEEVIAYVVCRDGKKISSEDLDRICLNNIARFKRPKAYVRMNALPKNNYGKVLKAELRHGERR
jgi:acyl-CoA synthetase (AMP-forming)/AMP-acid ligase II